jgi:hypothetical protein
VGNVSADVAAIAVIDLWNRPTLSIYSILFFGSGVTVILQSILVLNLKHERARTRERRNSKNKSTHFYSLNIFYPLKLPGSNVKSALDSHTTRSTIFYTLKQLGSNVDLWFYHADFVPCIYTVFTAILTPFWHCSLQPASKFLYICHSF